MLTGPTLDKLFALNLAGMARALAEQRESPAYTELPFEDRLGLLVDREATDRENRRLERYLRAAKLRRAGSIGASCSSSRRPAGSAPTSRS
jgi:hypothetical protein